MLKIFYIGSFGKLWDEEGIARAFEAKGCQVFRFEENNLKYVPMKEMLAQHRPDFVFWAKFKSDPRMRYYVLQAIREAKVKTVCYMPDLYWGLSRQWKAEKRQPPFCANFVLSPDGGNDAKWKENKINHFTVRQGIPEEYCYMEKPDPKYAFDVVFVGQLNPGFPYRRALIEWLRSEYKERFRWIGKLNSDEMRGHELNKLYISSKVIVGDSVYSAFYWSNRIYETIGRGGFIVHPKIPGLEQEFEAYKHFVPYNYNDFKSLREVIGYFLAHDSEREKIAAAGFEHVKHHHTLNHRCEQILKIIT